MRARLRALLAAIPDTVWLCIGLAAVGWGTATLTDVSARLVEAIDEDQRTLSELEHRYAIAADEYAQLKARISATRADLNGPASPSTGPLEQTS